MHAGIISASIEVVHRPRSDSFLHFDMRDVGQIRTPKPNASARRLLSADMLERWPQVCRVKIMFTLLRTNYFVSATMNSMICHVNWIPLRILVRSRNIQPYLNESIHDSI